MPEVHLPKFAKKLREGATRVGTAAHQSGGHSILGVVLEVALISVGVFLGLAGEQWRENARHRELAESSLRRFREEIRANRARVVSVADKHVKEQKDLQAYLTEHTASSLRTGPIHVRRCRCPSRKPPLGRPPSHIQHGTSHWRLNRWLTWTPISPLRLRTSIADSNTTTTT
jgi:hypothetical protein